MNWDLYFYNICSSVSQNSKCLSRKVGSTIVRNKYIISTGYNGPPSNCSHCSEISYREDLFEKAYIENEIKEGIIDDVNKCPRQIMGFISGKGLQYCQASHAERNAIYTAARLGHSVEGCIMYMNCGIPCFECSKAIVSSGISEIVVTDFSNYEKSGILGREILECGGVKIRKYENIV